MEVKTVEGGDAERTLLIGCIVSKEFLAKLSAKWERGMFLSKWANIIAQWCISHFNRYGEAPKEYIVSLYEKWAGEKNRSKEASEFIESILRAASETYSKSKKELNPKILIDDAERHFNYVRMLRSCEEWSALLKEGKATEAFAKANSLNRINLTSGSGIDVFQDEAFHERIFEKPKEPLFTYPGDAGKFFGCELEEDAFLAFMAPNKSGKSFWLMDLAWRAVESRVKTAFFQVGDLSERQFGYRLASRAARSPILPDESVRYPVRIGHPPSNDSTATVKHKIKKFTTPLTKEKAQEGFKRIMMEKTKSQKSYFRCSIHSAFSINIQEIKGILDDWERNGFHAKVVVIDYADILAPIPGKKDTLDQINETWGYMRQLSQERKSLVVTASQTKTASFNRTPNHLLSRNDFSDNRKKLDWPTAVVGINTSGKEDEAEVCRLNYINRRQARSGNVLYVAGCKAIGNPCVLSCF